MEKSEYIKFIPIITNDNNQIIINVYNKNPSNKVLIIASATGVKQRYYKKFAEFISSNGITVITFDYSGIGLSLNSTIKNIHNNALDWGKNDLESVIKYANIHFDNSKIILLGHSIGGQLIGLARSSKLAHKIILICAQSGYWKFWIGFEKIKMWANWYILFPALITIFGYMPSKKYSSMENLPKNVAKQWRKWCINQNYLFGQVLEPDLFFKDITTQLTALSVDDDKFAPKKAVDWLTDKYENAIIKKFHLFPKDFLTNKIGHFGIFRENFKDNIWKMILEEIEK